LIDILVVGPNSSRFGGGRTSVSDWVGGKVLVPSCHTTGFHFHNKGMAQPRARPLIPTNGPSRMDQTVTT